MTNKEADGDIHGECAAEIRRLKQWQNEASALLATFIGLSSRPDESEWSKVAIKVPALLAEEDAYKTDAESQLDRADAKDQLDACRQYLKEGETVADALIRMQKEVITLRNAAMRRWGGDRSACDKEDAAHDRRLAPERRSDQGDRRWHDTFTARQHAEVGLREGPNDRRKYGPCRRKTTEENS